MRRTLIGTLIATASLACGGSDATAPSSSAAADLGIAGTWTLRSVGQFNFSQQALPVPSPYLAYTIAADALKIENDGTFSEELTLNTIANGQSQTQKRLGSWIKVDSVLSNMRFPDMPAGEYVPAQVSSTTLLYHNIPYTYVFTRDATGTGIATQALGQAFRGCTLVKAISKPATVQGALSDSDCRLDTNSSGFYAEWRVDYYEMRLTSPATFEVQETSNDVDADWKIFDRATGYNIWSVSVKDVPERAWRRITLGAGLYVVAATSQFKKEVGSYTLSIQ